MELSNTDSSLSDYSERNEGYIFNEKIPKNFNKEKKMSLLVAVLLEIVFNDDVEKLNKIYSYLDNSNIFDIDVTTQKYSEIRLNLGNLIQSINYSHIEYINDNVNNNVNDNNNENDNLELYFGKYDNL
jgi:hypothetical protein